MASSAPTSGRSAAVTVVCLAVAVLAVFAAMNSYQVSARYAEQFPDAYGAGRAQLRFAPLLARLPVTAQLGYLTDLDPSSNAYAAAFLAAQYALAPRQLIMLAPGATPEWAVGNFSKPQDYARAGYQIVADYGNGVVLYRRASSDR
jgi:O-glycosyl hydrolase